MKLLKKMLLIKWYYIEHQLINFDSVNFMTGKNGAGKSTIIDALQIVMLGDTRGNFFNKAANDRGGRTLDGYLKGEISDDGDVGFKSIRNGRFTSYIALEFFDTVERKSITCGIVFDSYKDAPTDHMFFILNDEIPKNHFIDEETKTPMDYRKLKSYFARNYTPGKFTTYKESNKSYQNDFLAKMGAIKPKFFNLFKKSVTFTPIDDIEKFISEYVCDVTNEIDIESMKENIRQYKELEKNALNMQEREKMLQQIEELYKSYTIDVQKEYMQKYLIERSALQIAQNNLETFQNEYKTNLEKIGKLEEEQKELESKAQELSKIQNEKIEERAKSDIHQKQKNLTRDINEIKAKLNDINEKTQKLIKSFRNKVASWRVNIKEFLEQKNDIEELEEEQEIVENAVKLKDNIEYLLSINEENIYGIEEKVLTEIREQMEKINLMANKIYFQNEQKEAELNRKSETLTKEIQALQTGIKPYKSSLIEFKNKLKSELESKFNEKVEVQILADLLEIKDLKWKDAIECYINHQMFYIIMNPKYYLEAMKIYREISKENRYYGFGIVDVEKIKETNPQVLENSLAEEIKTENEYAKIYIDYLLGKVIKCEKTEDLRNYKSAITSDCMLYKNYVLRKIVDKNNEFKFIGANSILEQINLKQQELKETLEELEKMQKVKSISNSLKNAEVFSKDEIRYILDDVKMIQEKPELTAKKEKYNEELNSLDLTWLDKTSKEIENLGGQISTLNNNREYKLRAQAGLEEQNKSLKEEKIPNTENQLRSKEQDIGLQYTKEWIESVGEERFQKELTMKKPENIFKNYSEQIERTRKQKETKLDAVIGARRDYTQKYQFSYNILDRNSNKQFSEELEKIRDIELPKYIEKIKDSEEKAYEQFREEFISKLKANIDEVKSQIDELNDALKNSTFGVDKYHFNVKPKQEYKRFYDMITDDMLMEGQNLWSEAFNSKYHEEIEELFKKLTNSDSNDENYNKNISIYTDYKTYLSFDLVVTDKDGGVQHLSRTLDKKSGGETQTPFYISILASFAQLYRINKNRNDNTLRLIVFDEAFNKMDEERMKESLKLLKTFQFQAIIAAPSEKAGEIIPLVPNTLCVIKKGRSTIVEEWKEDKNALG